MMSVEEVVVIALTCLGFAGCLVFLLMFWKKIKFPKDLKGQIQVGRTSNGASVYLLHHKDSLQEVPLALAVKAVDRVLVAWNSMKMDPKVQDPMFWNTSADTLDDILVYVASYTEYDQRNGAASPDHQAACLIRVGRWFGKSVPCVMIRDGLFEPKTGEPIQHEICHALLMEATGQYDYPHTYPLIWTANGEPGNLQTRSRFLS